MPTPISHFAVPLALGLGIGRTVIPARLLIAGLIASAIPDLDVLAFRLGIAYSSAFGHRGFSHSLLFAAVLAVLAVIWFAGLRSQWQNVLAFIFVCTASHGLLDMLTNGGFGVAYFWPFSAERLFFAHTVIEVAPLSLSRLLSPMGLAVLQSELLWVWLPALMLLIILRFIRRCFAY